MQEGGDVVAVDSCSRRIVGVLANACARVTRPPHRHAADRWTSRWSVAWA